MQGKRIENTSTRDDPFTFVVGKGQVSHPYLYAMFATRILQASWTMSVTRRKAVCSVDCTT